MKHTTQANAAPLLEGVPPHAKAGVLAEAQVLQFLIDVRTRMDAQEVGPGELARRLKASPEQVSTWLRAETGVNARTMFLIARALGFDLRLAWTPLVDEAIAASSRLPQNAGLVAATKAMP
jgi:hypothetical protein